MRATTPSAFFLSTLLLCFALLTQPLLHAQRLNLPSSTPISSSVATSTPTPQPVTQTTSPQEDQVLKTYPDGTKRIVPLSSLNFRDDGENFGGPPQLSVVPNSAIPAPPTAPKLSIAPIGDATTPATASVPLPSAVDSTIQIPMANSDPMGGSSPVDPLSGAPTTPTPLQTVSGKPAPLSDGGVGTADLGTYDDFFMNTSVGGSIQGQLTARRVFNGNNMQAYPYTPTSGLLSGETITAENFTFEPGFRFDVEFGYNIYDWLAVSLQSGVIYNALDQYNVSVSTPFSFNGQSYNAGSYQLPADGELLQVPIQIDGILRWPGKTAFKPFIGGGVGAIWQQLDVNNITLGTSNIQANYCRSAFQFGYNAQLGANYTVAPGVDFYGVFKLLGAFTPRIGNYDFENSYNFALEAGIQSRF